MNSERAKVIEESSLCYRVAVLSESVAGER